ncbi:P-loop nucleoside triphosphate hydrolase [Ceratobasidium theobromae]|uniref:P-loop nucleoside triphosphate hydrolase n=1 Tax=Ceratobasidium theobromae TaxID=1582974 RepID=A0A5N5QSB0_9AGAM|nr:P-loop nucleoside triphosphate hydrolase [Ceratobasidium theobromae]
MPPKRKRPTTPSDAGPSKIANQRAAKTTQKVQKGKTVDKKGGELDWPTFFRDLSSDNQALNTVIAFCSSRKQIAITFSLLAGGELTQNFYRPLELERVAQIKALLPDIICFAYFKAGDLRVNAEGADKTNDIRQPEPDIYAPRNFLNNTDEEEHVLVLDFVETGNRNKPKGHPQGGGFALPVALTPAGVKTLIEERNERFRTAVDEFLAACAAAHEDPVALLSSAAHEHIPVDPAAVLVETSASSNLEGLTDIPSSAERPSIENVITQLKSSQDPNHQYKKQIVYERIFDKREACWGKLKRPLLEHITNALKMARGVTGFYSHQAAAINSIWAGNNVIVSTSTASGKSIIYQVPILCELERNKDVTAMLIYPTKALAQDQKAAIEHLLSLCPGLENIKVATYDGDTHQELRSTIRKTASIILTNFDMLHVSILPNEEHWRRFLKNLHIVVVDELHYYTGAFGSHVAMIMRRLRRICAANGNQDTLFVSCSATITNPRHNVEVITDDGAPAGQKHFLLWNPPYVDPLYSSVSRVDLIPEVCWLFGSLMKQGIRTIVFCKIRRTCEHIMKAMRAKLTSEGRLDILAKVKAYRGGYSQSDRRKIEHEAFSGNLLGIVATNALELGVDIGTLDAVIVLGFPFGLASLRQQMGRAGRRARDALTILVADQRPIDQHYVKHPEELFSENVGELHIDLDNKIMLESHLQCAAHEMPVHADHDQSYFGPSLPELCRSSLKRDSDGWYHANPKFLPFPSKYISIRGIEEEKYAVIDVTSWERSEGQAEILEEIEFSRAIFELYEGGVFMHQGQTYIVREVNHDEKQARIVSSDVNWITRPRDINAIQTHRIRAIKRSTQQAFYGTVQVLVKVFGFLKLREGIVLDIVDIQTPPYERMTAGIWIDVPKSTLALMVKKGIDPAKAIHGAQHAVLNQTHLSSDIKTQCKAPREEGERLDFSYERPARLIFYEAAGDGSGVCAKAFDHISTLLWGAFDTIEACPCEGGCPSCLQGTRCAEGNVGSSKIGASLILRSLLDIEIDPDATPDFGNYESPTTIVVAEAVRAKRDIKVEVEQ